VSGVPSGPANAAGLNNSGNDPSGAGNSAKIATRPATNTQGTTRRTPVEAPPAEPPPPPAGTRTPQQSEIDLLKVAWPKSRRRSTNT
jgi:hypothetical protein